MRISVVVDHRFLRAADGSVWTSTCFSNRHWQRYLTVFEEVRVIARLSQRSDVPAGLIRADGPGIGFADVPDYHGPSQFLRNLPSVRRCISKVVDPRGAVVLRVPSPLALAIWPAMARQTRPYGVEVVGDPYGVFAPGSVRHPLRPVFRRVFTRLQRWQCSGAAVAAYVTRQALQTRYPPRKAGAALSYSDVEMADTAFVPCPRVYGHETAARSILCVGSLAQLYKGPDVLIDAVAECVRGNLDLDVAFVGDGRYRIELGQRAHRAGIRSRVRFLGELPSGDAVRAQMDGADLFVMPSRTEGLPRAMIEAMGRAMPCIGANVGGVPELLPPDALVRAGDSAALARKIREVIQDPNRMTRMSETNWRKAHEYHDERQSPARTMFYRKLRHLTEEWLSKKPAQKASGRAVRPDAA